MSGSAAALVEDGLRRFNAADFRGALSLFARAAKEPGCPPEAECWRAHALMALGRLSEAERVLAALRAARPRFAPAREALGVLHQRRGRLARAAAELRAALRLAPKSGARRALAGLEKERAWRALKDGRRAQARRLAAAAGSLDASVGLDDLRAALAAGRERPRAARGEAKADLRRRERERTVSALASASRTAISRGRFAAAAAAGCKLLSLSPPAADEGFGVIGMLFVHGRAAEARALLSRARRLDLASIPRPCDRFGALICLGRYKEAFALGERILDDGASPEDLTKFYYPYFPQEDAAARRRHLKTLDALRAARAGGPWTHFYRGFLLGGDAGLEAFAPIERFPARRYGWMLMRVGWTFLYRGRYEDAARRLRLSLRGKPYDWRSHGFLAEAYACLGRGDEAAAELTRAAELGDDKQRGDALAWLGEIYLWLGRYKEAERALDRAVALGALWSHAWRGGARLKQGRAKDALQDIDEGLRLYPLDREAYGWRAEARLALGQPRAALAALSRGGISPWSDALAALAHAALGQAAAFERRYRKVPRDLLLAAARSRGLSLEDAAGRRAALSALLDLAGGFRREPFGRPVWLDTPAASEVE